MITLVAYSRLSVCFFVLGRYLKRPNANTVQQKQYRNSKNVIFIQQRIYKTRNSARPIADKPRDAFRGQLKSPNVVPFNILGIVSY